MRLVIYLLLRQTILRALIASLLVFSASICLQLILTGQPALHTASRRAVLFGSTIGGAWTIVRWRFFSGVQIVEGLGQPRWTLAFIAGSTAAVLMLACVWSTPITHTISVQYGTLQWTATTGTTTMNRDTLRNKSQIRTFDRIADALSRQTRVTSLRYGLAFIPSALFVLLLYVGKDDDLWQPIGTTGICLVLIEMWCKVYV